MARKDFRGAKKLAVIAQKLDPDLDDIIQIILVCDVHCCCPEPQEADEGGDRDWYKILGLDPTTADDASVRRQYNKMALNLHPDKNRFPGSADAFQLVCRAKAVLTDSERRRSYDSRRTAMILEKTKNCFGGFSGFNNNDKLGFAKFQDSGFARFRSGPGPLDQGIFRAVKLSENGNGNSINNNKHFGVDLPEVDADRLAKEKNKLLGIKKVMIKGQKKNTRAEKNGEKLQFPDLKNLEYSDSELNDFEKGRAKMGFGPGQLWAVYDTLDAMPRFYALINSVISVDDFKVNMTWLEPCPENAMERKWLCNGLPASCGKFRLGESENIDDHAIFSHLMNWKKDITLRDIYQIYPRKGETWAVFKNWKMDWCLDPERRNNKKAFEFDFVEILSDYSCDRGVSVAFLGKIKGFSTLFTRTNGGEEMVIPVRGKFRFSHRVSSFQMMSPNGNSRFFELDPASLPGNLSSFAFSEISTISGIFN
ncbi:chaperone protein dnaj [Phtheirospermum japonicum]|uniref:Chaperone protein dnaj n=1 Tax=Phtheirospermum japonicum TaxID=374723 RepID=A0A830C175_9LAMI|nr:chaperone protein dnaj [Phtheirospermum japonicum]